MIPHLQTILCSKWKRTRNCVLFFLIFWATNQWIHTQTGGFQCIKVHSDLTYRAEWDVPDLTSNELAILKERLNQPYTFFSSGGECYVFISQDEKYILKLFKHHHLRINSRLNSFTLPWGLDRVRLRLLGGRFPPEERLQFLFNSAKIAYLSLPQETGLLYLHLNKSDHLNQTLILVDALGIRHSFFLDHLEFALQSKAELVYPTLTRLLHEGDFEGIKKRITSLLTLFKELTEKGIADWDGRISRNFGFIGERAIRIDMGGLTQHIHLPPLPFLELDSLYQWLLPLNPSLAEFFKGELEKNATN